VLGGSLASPSPASRIAKSASSVEHSAGWPWAERVEPLLDGFRPPLPDAGLPRGRVPRPRQPYALLAGSSHCPPYVDPLRRLLSSPLGAPLMPATRPALLPQSRSPRLDAAAQRERGPGGICGSPPTLAMLPASCVPMPKPKLPPAARPPSAPTSPTGSTGSLSPTSTCLTTPITHSRSSARWVERCGADERLVLISRDDHAARTLSESPHQAFEED
jgi:hypothetical protein